MTPGRDDFLDDEDLDDEPPRSMFSSPWLRVALVLVVLGVIAFAAAPYVRESMGPASPPGESSPPANPAGAVATTPSERIAVTPVAPSVGQAVTTAPQSKDEPAAQRETSPQTRPRSSPVTKPEPRGGMETAHGAAAPAARASVEDPARGKTNGDASGDWWVQVAAFRDGDTARRLTERLRREGFRVDERHAAGRAEATRNDVALIGAAPGLADGLHRVRVGGFADRAAAVATLTRLEALGYERPFIGRGRE